MTRQKVPRFPMPSFEFPRHTVCSADSFGIACHSGCSRLRPGRDRDESQQHRSPHRADAGRHGPVGAGVPRDPISTCCAWVFCMSRCAYFEFRGRAGLPVRGSVPRRRAVHEAKHRDQLCASVQRRRRWWRRRRQALRCFLRVVRRCMRRQLEPGRLLLGADSTRRIRPGRLRLMRRGGRKRVLPRGFWGAG